MRRPKNADELVSAIYDDLKRVASAFMQAERPEHTLQPTAIVHEVYLRLRTQDSAFKDEAQFRALAASQMRRILVDHARRRARTKRGGELRRVPLEDEVTSESRLALNDALDLSENLERLAEEDPRAARIVELRYFGGLTHQAIADELEVSVRTVENEWRYARAWLFRKLHGPQDG